MDAEAYGNRLISPGPALETVAYLSFADADGFRGAAILPAENLRDALFLARVLGINPGGDVRCIIYPPDEPQPPMSYQGRLLTEAEVRAMDQEMRRKLH